MEERLRIGELGARLGLSTATLRYYESVGLLGEPERSPSGYRLYGDDDEQRLRFILRAKALDLSLDEVRSLLDLWREGSCSDTRTTLRHVVAHKIQEARTRAREAAAFADQLTHVYTRLAEDPDGGGRDASGACACIPDLPAPEARDLEAELALIEQSVCGCGARLDGADAGGLEPCGCGCCSPDGAPAVLLPTKATTKDKKEVRTP